MTSFKTAARRMMTLGHRRPSTPRARKSSPTFDRLEGRLVLSTASAPLLHDVIAVNRSFASFNVSYGSAVSALKATATTTTAPTSAGLAAFDASVEAAIGTLNTAIAADLSNLTATGPALTVKIDGYTATLQSGLEAAGAKPANSTNKAVASLRRESGKDLATAIGRADKAILTDTAPAGLSNSTITTANKAVFAAFEAFNKSIQATERTSVTAGTALDPSAVSTATATLKTSLGSAINGLGTSFTSSTSNPTSTIATELTNLSDSLTSISAPTAGNHFSSRRFAFEIGVAEIKAAFSIERTIGSAIVGYNRGLL